MQRLSVETATQLLDFTGGGKGPIDESTAREQLEGAVAVHNILVEHDVAYLADEVGMGKTYVALGTIALLRHFNPTSRILVMAPRENIQRKWIKELRNFVSANVRFPDLRIKAVHGAPARSPVFCGNLMHLLHETILDPDRDFFTRMTSFSLPLSSKDTTKWDSVRRELFAQIPWLEQRRKLFDLKSRERFKENVGRAINAVLPTFDLVVVDEGHNLKHGRRGSDVAARNQLISLIFGHPDTDSDDGEWPSYGPRAKRVLFLSATPVEDDYLHLWNQLDVFGKAGPFNELIEASDPSAQKQCAARFMIRRIAALNLDGRRLTKNLYRREWRQGGLATHDDPIEVADAKQQLVVALVQKKVAELLGDERFKNSFQIGMLASFESFLQTAKVAHQEETVFDDTDQTLDIAERQGIDVHAVNNLAADYRNLFGMELPHPKMDATVDSLAALFDSGEKTLVFVRRVASVNELRRKLNERYDEWVIERLRSTLTPALVEDFDRAVDAYLELRRADHAKRTRLVESDPPTDDEPGADDLGGHDSFFAWYFRGQTPVRGLLSGGQFALRFNSAGAVLGTFFEDNHVAAVLDVASGEVKAALAAAVSMDVEELDEVLRADAARRLSTVKRQQRGTVFLAYQAAALELLAKPVDTDLAQRARIMLEERFGDMPAHSRAADAPALADRLETRTFWTELRRRPALRNALWPEPEATDFRERFRARELRRELLSSMARLGHPLTELYVSSVNVMGSLRTGARHADDEEVDDLSLIHAYLETLEKQQSAPDWTGYAELKAAADHFDLLVRTNEPDVVTVPLYEASRLFGRLLRAQEPVAGMSGQVNETMVRQFRMPGYPLVLITTELLREGEDLHTFCSNVVHYGIAWMPSSTEQRVGRVDRVSSLTERRLRRLGSAAPDELLQVYYPHLQDTVERVQVERVLRRQFEFIRLLHEGFSMPRADRSIDLQREATRTHDPLQLITEPLMTAFPVRDEMLAGATIPLEIEPDVAELLTGRFDALKDTLGQGLAPIEWDSTSPKGTLIGTRQIGERTQPFTMLLRSTQGRAVIRCVSPIGFYSDLLESTADLLRRADRLGVRVCAEHDPKFDSYNLTVEGDVLLHSSAETDGARVTWLLDAVTSAADRLERLLLGSDTDIDTFREDLASEVAVER
jgi:hypothetical protein